MIAFSIVGIIESAVRICNWIWSPRILIDYSVSLMDFDNKNFSHISSFYKEHFCDAIHTKDSGHRMTAECIQKLLHERSEDLSGKKIIALGGSTTQGFDCKAKTRWTDELSSRFIGSKFKNLAKASQNSSYSIEVLKNEMLNGDHPDFVFAGDWINDLLPNQNKARFQEEKILVMRIYLTAYRWLESFRLLSNFLSDFSSSEFSKLDAISVFDNFEDRLKFMDFAATENESRFSESLKKYSQNYEIMSQLAMTYRFKVIVINFPYVKNYYLNYHPRLHRFFEVWIKKIKEQQREIASKYNFEFLDVETCYESNSK